MGQGIGGGLPAYAYQFEPKARYRNRRTYFTCESHVEVDTRKNGRPREFSTINRAQNRCDVLNAMAAERKATGAKTP